MRDIITISLICTLVFIPVMTHAARGLSGVDNQTKELCREYATNHPENSIPIERQEWLRSQGIDYVHYNYYQDCLDQRSLPVVKG